MDKNTWPYSSYPEGFDKLMKDIMPFWARPLKKMLGPLLIRILIDG